MTEIDAVIKAIVPSATHSSGVLSNLVKYTLPAADNNLLQHLTSKLENLPGIKVLSFTIRLSCLNE